MPQVTIYDVAKAANVSIATVSRVLNAPQQVNEETRQQVLATIDRLGFVPKAEATARARRRNQRIGVLAPFFTYPSFVQRLRGVASALNGSPYELVVFSADTPAHCRHYLESLPVAHRLDGLVIMSLCLNDRVAERILQHGLPTVLIETAHPAFSSVEIDNEAGGRLAATYLMGRGHTQLAFVGGDSEIPGYTLHTSELRLAGFRRALAEAGCTLPDALVRTTYNSPEAAASHTRVLMGLQEPPTAIFAASDTLALGVLKALREQHEPLVTVAVLGFDDLDIAEYIGLTTISQALDESGRVAVELLLSRIAEPARPVQHVRLPLQIRVRETS